MVHMGCMRRWQAMGVGHRDRAATCGVCRTMLVVDGVELRPQDAARGGADHTTGEGDIWGAQQPAPVLVATRAMCRVARHETHHFALPRAQGRPAVKIVPVSVLQLALQQDYQTSRMALMPQSVDALLNSFVGASSEADTREHRDVPRFARTTLNTETMRYADDESRRAMTQRGEPCLIVRLNRRS